MNNTIFTHVWGKSVTVSIVEYWSLDIAQTKEQNNSFSHVGSMSVDQEYSYS